jgi:Flp pilus assembly protein TadG
LRSRSRQRAQSTVEFGISAVVLVTILFGLIDLGRAFYFDVGMQGAVREGARMASWFDSTSGTNPTLYDAAIKASVDRILERSGLPDSVLQNSTMTCPTPTDGNTVYNPPYADSTYPTIAGQPWLYICYANTPGLDLQNPPSDNSYKGSDVNVILVMGFGFVSGFMSGVLGGAVHLVANTHMTVGGY